MKKIRKKVVKLLNSNDRRKHIRNILLSSDQPHKGQCLADTLGVTRQVIVRDIAILRAEGDNIIATPEGYLCPTDISECVTKIIAVSHKKEDIQDELQCIVKFGGRIKDVIIEHPLYGQITAMLMIKTLFDIQNFTKRLKEYGAEPLLKLTNGIHLHTIEADNEEVMKQIICELENKDYLINDN